MGVVGEGGFSHLVRFEAVSETGGVGLDEITGTCLRLLGRETAGLIIIGDKCGSGGCISQVPFSGCIGGGFFCPSCCAAPPDFHG